MIATAGNSTNWTPTTSTVVMWAEMDMVAKKIKTGRGSLVASALDTPHDPSLLHRLRIEILIMLLVGTYVLLFLAGPALSVAIESVLRDPSNLGNTCTVPAGGSESIDDAPAIIDAFNKCGQNGNVIFSNTTYYVNSVMNITGLKNCQVDIYGTLMVRNPLLFL